LHEGVGRVPLLPADDSQVLDAARVAAVHAPGTTAPQRLLGSPRQAAVRGKALELVTQLLLVTVVPRLLGPAEFGRMTVALAIVTLGALTITLGAPSAFVRFVPAESGSRRAGLARSMTLQVLPVRAIQLTAVAAIAALLVFTASRIDALDAGLVFVALAAEVGAVVAAQIALGMGETWIWSFRISARNLALLVLVPLLATFAGSAGVTASVALGSLAGFAFAASCVLPLVRHAEQGVPVPPGAMQFGRVAGVSIVLGQLTWRGPVIAASLLGLAADEVGFAGLAASIAMAIIFAVRELFTVSVPELVESWGRDQSATDRLMRRLGERTQWVLVASAILGVVALDRVLPLVVGDRFTPAVAPMITVLAMLPLLPLPAMGLQSASLRLRPGIPVAIESASLVSFIVASLVLVPRWHAVGATGALLVATVTSAVLNARALPTVVTPRILLTGLVGTGGVLGIAAAMGIWS